MDPAEAAKPKLQRIGRYTIFDEIAAGGMATVHLARLTGAVGFSRVVAVKRLHPHLVRDQKFKEMFISEARLAARVRHPNVVPILDVLAKEGEVILVMDYVHGESIAMCNRAARKAKTPIPLAVSAAIMVSVLHGLHAAHEACDEKGTPLGIVHRDVSPQNVLVGVDGVARVLDFGVAKAIQSRFQETGPNTVAGKPSYMAPEVLRGEEATRQADIFAASVVFWELLTGKKLFGGAGMSIDDRIDKVLQGGYPAPSTAARGLPAIVDAIVMKGLSPDVASRYKTALEMAVELENNLSLASQRVVGEWVQRLAAEAIEHRSGILQRSEVSEINSIPPPSSPLSLPPDAAEEKIAHASVPLWAKRLPAPAWAIGAAAVVLLGGALLFMRAPSSPASPGAAVSATSTVVAPLSSVAQAAPVPAPAASAPSAEEAAAKPATDLGDKRLLSPSRPPRAVPPSRAPARHQPGNAHVFLPNSL